MNTSVYNRKHFLKQLILIALPLIFQQFLLISVNTADSIMLGSINKLHMTAVSQAAQIFTVFTIICYGFTIGGMILISQYSGKNDYRSIRKIVAIILKLSTAWGVLITLLLLIRPSMFIGFYSNNPEIIRLASKYLQIVALSYLCFAISNSLFYALRGLGLTRIILTSNILSYGLNVLLDFLLIYGIGIFPEMGYLGVAVGTLISRIVELVFICGYIFFKEKTLCFKIRHIKLFDKELFKDYINVSKAIMAHEILWSIGTTMTPAIMGLLSDNAAASYNITNVLFQLSISPLFGISAAGTIMVGRSLGEGRFSRAKKESKELLALATMLGIALSVIMVMSGKYFVGFYNLDASTLKMTLSMIKIMSLVVFFSAYEYVGLVGILHAGGDGKTGVIADVISMWVIAIPLALIGWKYLQLSPLLIFAILKIDMPIKSIIGFVKVMRFEWLNSLTHS